MNSLQSLRLLLLGVLFLLSYPVTLYAQQDGFGLRVKSDNGALKTEMHNVIAEELQKGGFKVLTDDKMPKYKMYLTVIGVSKDLGKEENSEGDLVGASITFILTRRVDSDSGKIYKYVSTKTFVVPQGEIAETCIDFIKSLLDEQGATSDD